MLLTPWVDTLFGWWEFCITKTKKKDEVGCNMAKVLACKKSAERSRSEHVADKGYDSDECLFSPQTNFEFSPLFPLEDFFSPCNLLSPPRRHDDLLETNLFSPTQDDIQLSSLYSSSLKSSFSPFSSDALGPCSPVSFFSRAQCRDEFSPSNLFFAASRLKRSSTPTSSSPLCSFLDGHDPSKAHAESADFLDELPFLPIRHTWPRQSLSSFCSDSIPAVETAAMHVIFADPMFDIDNIPWLPSYSAGSTPTNVCVLPNICTALFYIARCNQRAIPEKSESKKDEHYALDSLSSCQHVYILVVNTACETSKDSNCAFEWNHQSVINICQEFQKNYCHQTGDLLCVLRAGDICGTNGKLTSSMISDRKIRWELARQIANTLNLKSLNRRVLTSGSTILSVAETKMNAANTDDARDMIIKLDFDQSGSLSQFSHQIPDDDTTKVTETDEFESKTFVLQHRCVM